jgi:hypothetical protein
LLGKFPDEPVRGGDFAYNFDGVWLELRNGCNPTQVREIWYRRRIEPVEPEPKHYVLRVGDSATLPNGQTITITAKGFEVTE